MSLVSLFQPLKPLNFKPAPSRALAAGGYQTLSALNAAPQFGVGGPTNIPYDEYGTNSSAPKLVGQVPAGYVPPADNSASANNGTGSYGGGSDWNATDPILTQIRALNRQMVANAENAALANRKTEQIGYGYDPNLSYEDPATAEAARQNKFSTLEQLLFGHTNRAHDLDENLNKANLFYSGERAKQIGLEGRQYTLEQSNAQQGLQARLAAITNSVLQARLQAQQQEIQGQSDAYSRYLQFALANGISGGGFGGGVGASGTGGSSTASGAFAQEPVGSSDSRWAWPPGDSGPSSINSFAAAGFPYPTYATMAEAIAAHGGGSPAPAVPAPTAPPVAGAPARPRQKPI